MAGNPRNYTASVPSRASIAAIEDADPFLPKGISLLQLENKLNSLSEFLGKPFLPQGISPVILENELNSLREFLAKLEELAKLEMNYTEALCEMEEVIEQPPPETREQREKLISEFDQWKQKKESYIRDHVTPYLSSFLTYCQQTLTQLLRVIELNRSSRSQQEDHISKTIFKCILEYAKGMLSEIQQDLEQGQLPQLEGSPLSSSSKKLTLDEYLQKTNEIDLCFASIRLRAVLSGIQLSELLAQYMFSLLDNDEEELLEKLVSTIKQLAEKERAENNNNNVAEKFVVVMEEIQKLIPKYKKLKKKKKTELNEDLKMPKNLIMHICSGISLLGFVLCDQIVPDSPDLVEGASKRIELILGNMLYNMQEIQISAGEMNPNEDHECSEMFMPYMKKFICSLWDMKRYQF